MFWDFVAFEDTNPPLRSRIRGTTIVRACVLCQRRKEKCNGLHPCYNCRASKQECIYSERQRRTSEIPEGGTLLQDYQVVFNRLLRPVPVKSLIDLSRESLLGLQPTDPSPVSLAAKTEAAHRLEALEKRPPDGFEWNESSDQLREVVVDDVNGLQLAPNKKTSFLGLASISPAVKVLLKDLPSPVVQDASSIDVKNGENMSKSIYTPLKDREIRLLVIDPSSDADTVVKCCVQTVSLDINPEYIALSYVWGNAAITTKILVNEEDFAATVNLAAALRQLRAFRADDSMNPINHLPSFLWVDAICINQNDIPERNSQVQLMRDIYQNSVVVISWLGPEADGSTEVISTLRNVSQEIQAIPPGGNQFDWLSRYPDLLLQESQTKSRISNALKLLWERDYWKRIWITQEIVLPRDILLICGAEIISWGHLKMIYQWLIAAREKYELPSFMDEGQYLLLFNSESILILGPIIRNQPLRDLWHDPEHQNIPLDHLNAYSRSLRLQATDPRDKVYEVYIEATLNMFRVCGLTVTLCLVGKVHRNYFELPSWAKDWSSSLQDGSSIQKPLDSIDGAEEETRLFIWKPEVPGVLMVLGKQIGEVTDLGPTSYALEVERRAWDICQHCLAKYRGRLYRRSVPLLQTLLRLLFHHDPVGNDTNIEVGSVEFHRLGVAFIWVLCNHGEYKDLGTIDKFRKSLPKLGLGTELDFASTFDQQLLGEAATEFPFPTVDAFEALKKMTIEDYVRVHTAFKATLEGNLVFGTGNEFIGLGQIQLWKGMWFVYLLVAGFLFS
ncbi:uncharacterized protein PAC_05493 [Phialocephala subalpina]|uniref:Zn(2)-C6 fungal-type domain-containing protein n=1 Tax=Phialocephala subalpina TaxID=576137 RepID=A0A1L7WS81_9HELO|nr:uncharacterized protein PAC_05493 [Phialocephala subalpina]